MTYSKDNQIRKYVKGYGFMSFAENVGSKYGKKFLNKGIPASKIIQDTASKFNQSKYGKMLKNQRSVFRKIDMPKSGHDNNANLRQRIIYSIKDSESFNYKTKLIGNVPGVADPANGDDTETELEDIKTVVALKSISNFMFN